MRLFELTNSIQEARRNPERNPKKNGFSAAYQYLNSVERGSLDYIGVSMTSLPKLGLNPQSQYNTPVGVYFYPALYYMKSGGKVEFQSDAPYIQIFKINTNNILWIDTMDVSDYNRYISKIFNATGQIASLIGMDEKDTTRLIANAATSAPSQANVDTYGGQFWYVMYCIANYEKFKPAPKDDVYKKNKDLYGDDDAEDDPYAIQESLNEAGQATRSSVIWNKLLRMLGIDVVIDDGSKVLHQNEPTQGVVLDTTTIQHLKTFDNKEESTDDEVAFKKETKGLRSMPFVNKPDEGKLQFAVKMDIMGKANPVIYKVYANNETAAKYAAMIYAEQQDRVKHSWIKRSDAFKI